jgi:hypothetical protein
MFKKTMPLLALVAVIALMLGFVGCSKDDDDTQTTNPPAYEPEYSSGQTGADGNVSINMGSYNLDVHVEDEANQAVSGADVLAFQGQNVAYVWAEGAGYYSGFQLVDLANISSSAGGSSASVLDPSTGRTTSGTDVSLSFELIDITGFVYELANDPPNIAGIYSDEGFQEYCITGTLDDVYEAFDLFLTEGRAVRVYGSAAALRGVSSINFIFSGLNLTPEVFDELMFDMTGLVPTDSIEFCYYTLLLEGNTYYLPHIHIGELTYESSASDFKFILTWGQDPQDLDSHLYTPEIEGSSYHVYYASRGSETTAPYAWLDVDDVSGFGPEVVTIVTLYPGTYHYAIYEYGGLGTITTSGAQVQVFDDRDLIGTYSIPTGESGENWWWYVGDVDGATGDFTLVNTVQAGPPTGAPPTSMPTKTR